MAKTKIRLGDAVCNVLVLGLLGWSLIWLFVSDRFYVNQIVVDGNQRVSADVIQQTSGLEGYSVFWINPRQVAADIARSLPPITRVRVEYGLSNVVTLTVEEHSDQAAAVIWQVAGQRYWVDDEGILHPASGEQEPGLLVQDMRPGPPDRVDLEALVAARQVVHLLPELHVIEYAPITGLRLVHPRGWMVYLGTGQDMARKVSILRAMEVRFAGEAMFAPTLIDLRFPDSPYYRLSTEPADMPRPADGN